ncbi:MAG: class I SAM-dependent methyltransferase [Pseudomonadota bacterium]
MAEHNPEPYRFAAGAPPLAKSLARRLVRWRPVFRLFELWRAGGRVAETDAPADGLPTPGPYLRTLVVGHADRDAFLSDGRATVDAIDRLMAPHGNAISETGALLDFGCGCGRLSRHFIGRGATVIGVDANRRLARWCARHLPGRYAPCALDPPLPLEAASADGVVALSVFTHLDAPRQDAWLQELARVARPGAWAMISFHDERHPYAEGAVLDAVTRDGFAVRFDALEGTNLFSSYQSHAHVRARWAAHGWRILDTVPGDETGFLHGAALLRRDG